MSEPERWQQCEDMNHVGPTQDPTVHWRELGLMCDTCFAAFGDTRPLLSALREVVAAWDEVLDAPEVIVGAPETRFNKAIKCARRLANE